jgi:hypothetical protein
MAAEAREQGRAQLAANLCVKRFLEEPDAAARLADLKEEGEWNRDNFVEEGGWVTFADMEEPVEGAAQLCATELVEMNLPAANDAAAAPADSEDSAVN